MAAAEVAQGLDGHVDADLVAILEAVGDGLRGRIYADLDALQAMRLYTFGDRRATLFARPVERRIRPCAFIPKVLKKAMISALLLPFSSAAC